MLITVKNGNQHSQYKYKPGRKNCGKGTKTLWFPAFPPFSTMISIGFSLRVVNSLPNNPNT